MTRRLSLSLFALLGLRSAQKDAPLPAPPNPEDRIFVLDRLLQLDAHRGDREPVKLFTSQMSLRSVLFRSNARVREGEPLTVRLLLRADRVLILKSTVVWLHEGPHGYSGQLDLQIPPEHHAEVLAYLEHRAKR